MNFLRFIVLFIAFIVFCAGLAFSPVASAHGLTAAYKEYARPLQDFDDLTPLITAAQDKRLVLLGETTHGTREYYQWRAAISKRLITDHGFSFVVVEGDWASFARLNRYVRHEPGAGDSARALLRSFDRWPRWMWANAEFEEFVEWLRDFNSDRPPEQRVGLYGMDVYSAWDALDMVVDFYRDHYPDDKAAQRAHYRIFEDFRDDPHGYARARRAVRTEAAEGVVRGRAALEALWAEGDNNDRPEDKRGRDLFFAKQAAYVVQGAESFYRSMTVRGPDSWNYRARHMAETAGRLLDFYSAAQDNMAQGIVWAHNTHIGDARATAMGARGEVNIGQLSRETYGDDNVLLAGFATYQGTVLAGREWGGRREYMTAPPAPDNSFEARLRAMDMGDALLMFPHGTMDHEALPPVLRETVGHRAIGVVYNPTGDHHQYVPTIPALRYDALLYIENTNALSPLHMQE